MRSLAVWTTTAAVALMGAANAQTAPTEGAAASADLPSAITAYAAYQNDVSDLRSGTLGNANQLEEALDRVARHNRDALTRGWIAYGAQTAAQSPAYVQGVREAAAYYGRDAVIWAVSVDPSYARGLRGGQEVTRMLLDSANADSARIVATADRYQELAYSLQRQRWANAVAPQQAARVQRVRSLGAPGGFTPSIPSEVSPRLSVAPLSVTVSDPTAYGGRRFWDAVRGGANVTEASATPTVTHQFRINATRGEAIDRMAAVAALQALDATESHQSAVGRLIADPRSRDCFEMAQLQLYQCMSAARFRYENAFCLGQHGLRDIGTCIGAVATPDASAALTPIVAGAREEG
jgi:ribosomal protein S18 acetylase RimI-like enzyme